MSSTTKVIILEQGLSNAQGQMLAEPLLPDDLELLLGQADLDDLALRLPGPVYLAGSVTSSFDLAHELIRRDPEAFLPWSSVLVVRQSAGRGQLRRKWESGAGNLHVSVRLPDLGCHDSAVPLAMGVLWQQAVANLGGNLLLKWPNDLVQPVLGGGPNQLEKVGGILLEQRNNTLVAGVGLNLRQAPALSALAENHALPAGILRLHTGNSGPDQADSPLAQVWAALAKGIFSCYFQQSSASQGREQGWWKPLAEQALAWHGQMVEIADQDLERNVRGIVAGLREDGSLLLRSDGGIISISQGSPRLIGG